MRGGDTIVFKPALDAILFLGFAAAAVCCFIPFVALGIVLYAVAKGMGL